MATGSADRSELSITIPGPLEEWLAERADALDADSDEVVVQLLASYRKVADQEGQLDDVDGVVPLEDRVEAELDERLDGFDPDALDEVYDHVSSLESDLDEKIEDVRHRVLQIRDAVQKRAAADHEHEEIDDLTADVAGMSADLDDVATDLASVSGTVEELASQLRELEQRQTRLARIVVALREQESGSGVDGRTRLEDVRRTANRRGVPTATCAQCRHAVRIGLLSEATCPHCETEFEDLVVPESILGALDPRSPKLVGPSASEPGDEDA